jgi:YHS domain-containing protein
LAWTLAGCGGGSQQPSTSEIGGAKQSEPAEHGEHEHGSQSTQQEAHPGHEEADHQHEHGAADHDALSKLSDADRALTFSQKSCPVSEEVLGSMGTPLKVTAKGETFFLCCKDCQKKLDADPDKYLAVLAGRAADPVL